MPKAKIEPGEMPLDYSASRVVLAKLSENAKQIKNAKALYRTTVSYDGSRSSFRYSLLCAPESMRLEMLPLNSAYALSIVIVRDGKALLLDTQERSARFAVSAQELLKRNIGFPLGIEELCAHLLGRPSQRELQEISDADIGMTTLSDSAAGLVTELVIVRPHNHKLSISSASGLLSAMEVYSEFTGKLDLSATFGAVKSFESVQVPTQVSFSLSSVGASVSMQLVAFGSGKALDQARFNLEIPAGYKLLPG